MFNLLGQTAEVSLIFCVFQKFKQGVSLWLCYVAIELADVA